MHRPSDRAALREVDLLRVALVAQVGRVRMAAVQAIVLRSREWTSRVVIDNRLRWVRKPVSCLPKCASVIDS